MTIVLTKDVRVGGSVLASGTTQTLAADVEADLVARGCATPSGLAPGVSPQNANHLAEHQAMGATVGAASVTYDSQGRVATHDGWTVTYDATTGRAASQTNGVKTQTFSYDSVGRYAGYVES